ncbi:Orn/Lys/Arg decarboxylase N-terminal domain-containing protein [Enterobacter cloacae]|uniref:Orn/Lys/Arg family decarboxylase n=1 Tax=Enterobacter cloacae TaxID=550 RepID=UPI0033548DD6
MNNQNTPVLIISLGARAMDENDAIVRMTNALSQHDYSFFHAVTEAQSFSLVREVMDTGAVILHCGDPVDFSLLSRLIKAIRARNSHIPVFISATKPVLGGIPADVVSEIHEYINLNEDTAEFISGRIHLAIQNYLVNLLPPYFSALKNYATDSPYYWDCPGHQGGVAYLKHPVGRAFFDFFGENLMRADIGIATPEMGDWLEHKGVPGASEARAARLFGADRTFYVTGGSSQSNQIIGHSLPLKDKVVLVDRNCHKSVNHELTISQGNPVYFQPSRNGYGIIGLISPEQFTSYNIRKKLDKSILCKKLTDREPAYAIITNCTYDGLIYDATAVTHQLADSVPRIKYDEAWYAYAKFHPLYRGRFAMDIPEDENLPTLYAVQSTHKMLAAFSSASMIHIKNSERAPVDYEVFNQTFMMHGTTSPFYPVIASIDVATSMMEGAPGTTLIDDAIRDAISFRKTMLAIAKNIHDENPSDWFFGVWQPEKAFYEGKMTSLENVPDDVLSRDASCWTLRSEEEWHGFGPLPDDYAMLDPIKVTITCPGINIHGEMAEFGIPAPVVSKFLDTQRIIPARNGDYNILILFALGSTLGKWNTFIDLLLLFKHHHDKNTPLSIVLPDVCASDPCYQAMGLGDLCRAIHQANIELNIAPLLEQACSAETLPVMSPSRAYEFLVADNTERVPVHELHNRTVAVMVTPYPPGIPLIMPGEKITHESKAIVDYLVALQTFDQRFPGFEHELQGVEIDEEGNYCVRCIRKDDICLSPNAPALELAVSA